MVVSYSSSDSVTVKRWFSANPQGIERIRFADGTNWDRVKINSMVDAPTVQHALAAQNLNEDSPWVFVVPADTFASSTGSEVGLSATLSGGQALPSWLHFDAATRTFTGTPLNEHVGSLSLSVIARDLSSGGTATTNLMVGIANVNDTPMVLNPTTTQTVAGGLPWSYTLPQDLFRDIDAGDSLGYQVVRGDGSALPSWLSFDAATRTFSGNPGVGDLGTVNLQIIATDIAGASATNTLQILVSPPVLGQTITGTGGNDVLNGGAGNDIIDGGWGADTMTGGAGNDTYKVDTSDDIIIEQVNGGVDKVALTLFQGHYNLSENVENLTAFSSGYSDFNASIRGNTLNNVIEVDGGNSDWSIQIYGDGGNDTLKVRNSYGNLLVGGAGDDIFDGAIDGATDWLNGGAGNDTFLFGRGSGIDTIEQDDDLQGETDTVLFGAGVTFDQLWFKKDGQFLEVSIIGTSDSIRMRQEDIEKFQTSDGKTLLDGRVQNLVQAMSAFAPPAAGLTTLPANYQTSLAPVLAANWQ